MPAALGHDAGNGHWLQTQVYDAAMQLAAKVSRMKDVPSGTDAPALECDAVQRSAISGIDLANGSVRITVELKPEIFYQVLSEQTGLAIGDEAGLMPASWSWQRPNGSTRRCAVPLSRWKPPAMAS